MNQFLISVANVILDNEYKQRQTELINEVQVMAKALSDSLADPTNEDLKIKLTLIQDRAGAMKERFVNEMAELTQSADREITS